MELQEIFIDMPTKAGGIANNSSREKIFCKYLAGHGPTFVYCPGYLSDHNATKANFVLEYCRHNNFSFLVVNYPAHGNSTGNIDQIEFSDCLDSLAVAIEHFKIHQPLIVGSSFGAWIAVCYALKYETKSLLLIAPGFDFTHELLSNHLSPKQNKQLEQYGFWAYPQELYQYKQTGTKPDYRISLKFIKSAEKHLILQQPVELACPIEILYGTQDEIIPLSIIEKFKQMAKNCNLRVITQKTDHSFSSEADCQLIQTSLQYLISQKA